MFDPYGRAAGFGMTKDVRQRLLDDPVRRDVHAGQEDGWLALHMDGDLDAGSAHPFREGADLDESGLGVEVDVLIGARRMPSSLRISCMVCRPVVSICCRTWLV